MDSRSRENCEELTFIGELDRVTTEPLAFRPHLTTEPSSLPSKVFNAVNSVYNMSVESVYS